MCGPHCTGNFSLCGALSYSIQHWPCNAALPQYVPACIAEVNPLHAPTPSALLHQPLPCLLLLSSNLHCRYSQSLCNLCSYSGILQVTYRISAAILLQCRLKIVYLYVACYVQCICSYTCVLQVIYSLKVTYCVSAAILVNYRLHIEYLQLYLDIAGYIQCIFSYTCILQVTYSVSAAILVYCRLHIVYLQLYLCIEGYIQCTGYILCICSYTCKLQVTQNICS